VVHRVQPLVDIFESPEGYHITADVPGVDQNGLSLRIEGDALHIEGMASWDNGSTVRRPYNQLQYVRSFKLGRKVDREHIDAELAHGVLKIKLPKQAEAQPRQISVRVSGEQPQHN
jgi:HSP20 family molecular chaperone IbpA